MKQFCRENLEIEIHHHPHYQSLNEKLMSDFSRLIFTPHDELDNHTNIKGRQFNFVNHPPSIKPRGVTLIENWVKQIIKNDLSNGLDNTDLRFRFPPEPNGFLHIGHAKSICLNFGFGKTFSAPVNLRFDDTNPEKESTEFIDAIKKDITWLGFQWDSECYASDYFDQLYDWAVMLIKKGKAYVDSQSQEEISEQRGVPTSSGKNSPHRDREVIENLDLFEKMKNGHFKPGDCVLRAKIDMSSSNMHMRDPVLYRIINTSHHRTNDKWKIYPTYDWAHGQSDYIEQISHSFCTLEFEVHRELYDWFLQNIYDEGKLLPKQREFARLNLSYTIMSKRKLSELVDSGLVSGWDDPRMPTISGLRRRGVPASAIIAFCEKVGVSKRENIIDFALLDFCTREILNKISYRLMVVLDPVELIIENYENDKSENLVAENNPEDESYGNREITFSKKLFIRPSFFKIVLLLFIKDLFFLATLFIDTSTNEPGLTFNSFLNDLNSEIMLIIFSTSF